MEFYLFEVDGWARSLDKLLGRPAEAIYEKFSLLSTLIAAVDKYPMPNDLMDDCRVRYMEILESSWDEESTVAEFIASIKIIYQTAPEAGLRGRAITTAQHNLTELQHRKDFRELMLSTTEFAVDIATKGVRQSFWCRKCSDFLDFEKFNSPVNPCGEYHHLWDWIDQGKPQDWRDYKCTNCEGMGTIAEERPERDDMDI